MTHCSELTSAYDQAPGNTLAADFFDEWDLASKHVSAILLEAEAAPSNEGWRQLFRVLHSMKSNLRMMELADLSGLIHQLEDLIAAVQSNRIPFAPVYCDLVLAVVQRTREIAYSRIYSQGPARALPDELNRLLGDIPAAGPIGLVLARRAVASLSEPRAEMSVSDAASRESELSFFRQLSAMTDARADRPQGSAQRTEQMAQALNALAGEPVDAEQLAVAAALRDVGLGFLPGQVTQSEQPLDSQARDAIGRHPEISAGLLAALPHWREARTMILQHHERVDGSGYPAGLVGDEIHLGARLLAVVDTFEAMTQRRPHREARRPILRVVAEVNALSGKQFDPYWVEIFNRWVRQTFVRPVAPSAGDQAQG